MIKQNSLNSSYVNITSDRFLFGYYTNILTYMTCVVVYVRVLCTAKKLWLLNQI